MKKLTSSEIRQIWLDFFVGKRHHLNPSVSLIPQEDPTLLWINAGITPLKKYFDGSQEPVFRRLVNCQKCLRTNDIDNIGKTSRHNTFFEMLGNFSIGDYFKKEAIDFAYELLTSPNGFALSVDRLYITYFEQDKETYHYWLQKNIKPQHLLPLKNNFWEIGEGPCGPCTEIFFDRGVQYDYRDQHLIAQEIENDRFIELWNIVFSQYNADHGVSRSEYSELPRKNIDTGAGLERLACVLQQTPTNFETDLFLPIIEQISFFSQIPYQGQRTFKIIADHIKTLVFGICDGAIFSNIGRGYVLRKILRKAVQQGQKLNFNKPFLFKLVEIVIKIMQEFYPDLLTKQKMIENIIQTEEEKFLITLASGKIQFKKFIYNQEISGANFFKLYDTYGLPKEIILEYASQQKVKVNVNEFKYFLQKQKDLSRKEQILQHDMKKQNSFFLEFRLPSIFIGYECFKICTKVLKVFEQGIVLEQTPFYATMGGQICDSGYINDIFVTKVTKLPYGQFLHQVPKGIFQEGQEVVASINIEQRIATALNHTATHLLYDALKKFLGEHIKQQGSFVGEQYLRFDFNHFDILSPKQLIQIENQVNQWIENQYSVMIKEMTLNETKKIKAQFLDNTSYQEQARVVQIGDVSIQLCGGTHAKNTKDLHRFTILDYYSIGSGVHRLEATTGKNLTLMLKKKIIPLIDEEQKILKKIKQNQKYLMNNNFMITPKIDISFSSYQDLQNLKHYLKSLNKDLNQIQKEVLKQQIQNILKKSHQFIPCKIEKELLIMIEEPIELHLLKVLLDHLFESLQTNFLCLCQKQPKQFLVLCKSKTVDIRNFINNIKPIINGYGGGNKYFGQICSPQLEKLNEFITKWKQFL
ncbi:alanine--tRNA ligase [Candidatus Phytoplasma phoenicium]|uniref:Alanine--tRNA ligase n=1 Tax=Candidatus Phytoplasma phoenicium TaxID=198422 RepID=A0A0L0MJY7_9MOLU|nr:alanine--tRNA ligase [Candidatus Phytoplasma phoenicium]KND62600.1 Alanyl-tRNA synthetase [Candidatus Phytoplasma phoenicium]